MKKFCKSLLIVGLIMMLLLSACTPAPDVEDSETKETTAEDGNQEEVPIDVPPLELTPSMEMARLMGYGINLGNTMEACDAKNRIPGRETSVYETIWGQPITTQAMITGMKEAGFKTLRIPVAWTNAMDFENDDFIINEAYLDRVAEIINYALNEDMYVVVNAHWDHGWWSMFGHPEQEIRDKAMTIYESMWTQIAEKYKDFDDRLVLEAANEELGSRLNDKTPFSQTGGKLREKECYEMATVINQKFIDIVRGSGGNNAERFLLIKGFNTDIEKTMDDRYVMPVDPAEKILLGVHFYNPWDYCGDTAGVEGWGTTEEFNEMNGLLGKLTKFTEQGYGIVIGEWGVLDNVGEDRVTYFKNFLSLCDKYGYAPVMWDTGGLYCRKTNKIKARNDDDSAIDKIADLFKNRSVDARAALSYEEIVAEAQSELALLLKESEDRPQFVYEADEAFAWIMFTDADWAIQYSVGNKYKKESITKGVVATDVEVTDGAGTYTVGLDFTGTENGYANGIAFSALGIINGEILFPGYVVELKEILINGEAVDLSSMKYFTTNDNPTTTRVNLYNEWVEDIPKEARTADGDLKDLTAIPLADYTSEKIETLEITFEYVER